MSLKNDIKDVQEETKNLEKEINNNSLALDILHDLKQENKALKVLLGLSILVNVLIAIIK